MSLQIGTHVGPYEILSAIGAGGMGEVWKARDTRLDRVVAIKTIYGTFSERFEREARAISSLNHPHICALHDVGEHHGAGYLVLEYVEGASLKGPLPLDQALKYAAQICDALDAAHRKGIIHRDLKPDNILLTKAGIKLLDFGLAKLAAPAVATSADTASGVRRDAEIAATKALTGAHMILGTPQYMAPEQIEGRDADARTDLFAFGCVLYELLTGQKAFDGKTPSSTMAAILATEPRPLRELQPVTPPALERVVRRCLAKDPDDRWQTARDLRAELEWVTLPGAAGENASSITPVGSTNPIRRLLWPLAILILIVALGMLSARHFGEASPDAPLVTSNLSVPDDSAYAFDPYGPPALSPDGRAIVFAATTVKGVSQLWVRRLDSPTARPLNGTIRGVYPFWSPDGRFVAFGTDGQLKKVDVAGGPAVVIATLPATFRGGSWNASDDILVGLSGNNRPLFRVSAAGGSIAPATATGWHGKPAGRRLPWFLPDGRHFLHNATWGPDGSCICVGTLDKPEGESDSQVVATAGQGMYVDGHILYTRDRTLFAQPFDVTRLTTTDSPVPIASDIATTGFPRAGVFSAAAGGWLVYQPVPPASSRLGGLQQLTWFDRSGRSIETLGAPASFGDINLSPDGTRLGATQTAGDGSNDLWIYDVARGVPTRFTTHPASDQETVWSPDGRTIYWRSGRQGPGDLFKKPADSSSVDELVYASVQAKRPTSVSPDGRFLIFNNTPTENGDLWLLPLTADPRGAALEPRPLLQTPAGEGLGQFSPDGAWVAYQSNESGVQEIYAMPFPGPGGKVRISVDGGTQPRWRHDGKEIFYVNAAGELTATEVTLSKGALVPGRTQTLFGRVPVTRGYQWDVSNDGQHFVVAAGDASTLTSLTLLQNWKRALIRK